MMDKIVTLQREHDLTLPEEFHFKYAQVADSADLSEQALEAVVRYLATAGRGGQHYVEALELMNKAQDEIEGRKDSQAASPEQPLPTQLTLDSGDDTSASFSQAGAAAPSEAQPAQQPETAPGDQVHSQPATRSANCNEWNTREYFREATAADVAACLKQGADLKVKGEERYRPIHTAAAYSNDPKVIQVLIAAGAKPQAILGSRFFRERYGRKV